MIGEVTFFILIFIFILTTFIPIQVSAQRTQYRQLD